MTSVDIPEYKIRDAFRHLARYSYRTAIANSRIVSVGDSTVSFRYKDYADGGKEKVMTLDGEEFIDRFLRHVLPAGFHRIRFAGFLSNSRKTANLRLIHKLRGSVYNGNPFRKMSMADLILSFYGKDICSCPKCSGRLLPFPRGIPLAGLEHFLKDFRISQIE